MNRLGPSLCIPLVLSACSIVDAVKGNDNSSVCTEFTCWSETVLPFQSQGLATAVVVSRANTGQFADIVFATGQGEAFVLRGDGEQGFSAPIPLTNLGPQPIIDMATVDEGKFSTGTEHIIAFSRPNGATIRHPDGSVVQVPLTDDPGAIAVGDFDDDALPDVAVGHGNGEISILLQAKDFTPEPIRLSNPQFLSPVVSLAIGRFLGPRSCHDLVVAQDSPMGTQTAVFDCAPISGEMFGELVIAGDVAPLVVIGAAKFTPGPIDQIAIGTACTNNCEDYDVVRAIEPEGRFLGSLVHGSLSSGTFQLADMVVGNFDREAGPDVVLAGAGGATGPDFMMAFGADFSNGGFAQVFEFRPGDSVSSAAVGDLNQDQRDDIVVLHPEKSLRVFLSE